MGLLPFFYGSALESRRPNKEWVVKDKLCDMMEGLLEAVVQNFPFVIPSCVAVW